MVQLHTPAKVNLTLSILGRRADGFHEIESWVIPVSLFDDLTVERSERFELTVRGDASDVPADGTNLVSRAAHALAEAVGREPAVRFTLTKRIPIGAGLGGGSSDAAASLLALNKLWRLNWPTDRLAPIAAQVGSDVPFFLDAKPAILRGRGELLSPAPSIGTAWLALIVPPYPLATTDVYQRYAATAPPKRQPAQPWTRAGASTCDIADHLFNDLQGAAFACAPRLAALHARLHGLSGRPVHLTGSGSCLFTLFDTRTEMEIWLAEAQPRLDAGVRILSVEPVHGVD